MRLSLRVSEISRDELPDVIDALGSSRVVSVTGGPATYTVTSREHPDPRWLAQQLDALDSFTTATRKANEL